MNRYIEVFDRQRKRVAILDKAYNIGYSKEINKLGTAQFSLPINDPKNAKCTTFNYITLYENGDYIDLYRIIPKSTVKNDKTSEITYNCEHVLGTLMDKIMFQYHEDGGKEIYTADVIRRLLEKQEVKNWILGRCDFDRQFQYSWENAYILNALLNIPKEFGENYLFTYDTTVYPWVLNLVRPDNKVKTYFRYERNMKGITKSEDGGAVCTRLYALGYGEGVNQLTVAKANPTGLPYIEADTVGEYGAIEKIWTDKKYQVVDSLYAAAQGMLEKLKNPKVTYDIDALELWHLTNIAIDKFDVGDMVRVIDSEIGTDVVTRIVRKDKSNIDKDYVSVKVDLSNDDEARGNAISALYERSRIQDTYSQGATIIMPFNFDKNCDPEHPAKIRLKIPEQSVYINTVELSFQADNYQAYSKGNEAVAATTSGPSSETTSGASSNTTSGASSAKTTEASSETTSGASSAETTGASSETTSGASSAETTGASSETTSGASSAETTDASSETTSGASSSKTTGASSETTSGASSEETTGSSSRETSRASSESTSDTSLEWSTGDWSNTQGEIAMGPPINSPDDDDFHWHPFNPRHKHRMQHTHGMDHTHDMEHTHEMEHTHDIEHDHNMDHTHGMEHTHEMEHTHSMEHTHEMEHTHGMEHTHEMDHTHGMEHTHEMDHTHGIKHTHEVGGHNHEIIFGIYEGPIASQFTVKVDDVTIPIDRPQDDIDIVKYLSKNESGEILRGWHEVLIYPNDLCGINADIIVQTFVNSRGGGHY